MKKQKQQRPEPRPAPPLEVIQANRDEATRLMTAFRRMSEARVRRPRRLVILRKAPPGEIGGVCVGPNLAALARLYTDQDILLVGLDREAVVGRWPTSTIRLADAPPPPQPGDRWVYYDPAANDGEGGWRLARPP